MIYNNHLFPLTWKLDIYTLIIQSHEKQEEKDKLVAGLVNLCVGRWGSRFPSNPPTHRTQGITSDII
jgi:hypothetical protein